MAGFFEDILDEGMRQTRTIMARDHISYEAARIKVVCGEVEQDTIGNRRFIWQA